MAMTSGKLAATAAVVVVAAAGGLWLSLGEQSGDEREAVRGAVLAADAESSIHSKPDAPIIEEFEPVPSGSQGDGFEVKSLDQFGVIEWDDLIHQAELSFRSSGSLSDELVADMVFLLQAEPDIAHYQALGELLASESYNSDAIEQLVDILAQAQTLESLTTVMDWLETYRGADAPDFAVESVDSMLQSYASLPWEPVERAKLAETLGVYLERQTTPELFSSVADTLASLNDPGALPFFSNILAADPAISDGSIAGRQQAVTAAMEQLKSPELTVDLAPYMLDRENPAMAEASRNAVVSIGGVEGLEVIVTWSATVPDEGYTLVVDTVEEFLAVNTGMAAADLAPLVDRQKFDSPLVQGYLDSIN